MKTADLVIGAEYVWTDGQAKAGVAGSPNRSMRVRVLRTGVPHSTWRTAQMWIEIEALDTELMDRWTWRNEGKKVVAPSSIRIPWSEVEEDWLEVYESRKLIEPAQDEVSRLALGSGFSDVVSFRNSEYGGELPGPRVFASNEGLQVKLTRSLPVSRITQLYELLIEGAEAIEELKRRDAAGMVAAVGVGAVGVASPSAMFAPLPETAISAGPSAGS